MDTERNLRVVLLLWCVSIISSYDNFSPRSRTTLRQIVVDDVSGNIYLGADNLLCQLNPELDLMYEVSLGPVMDNEDCIPTTAKLNAGHCLNPSAELRETNNIVKVLVIDQHQSALIVCGNVYQGSCQMRNLQNIEELINYPTSQGHWVIANKGDNASFGFIAAGPSGTNVFYVGGSFAEPDSALVILPSVAIRKIDKTNVEQMFKLYKDSKSENKRTLSRSRSRNAHVIYNGGFASGSYRYFSTIKPITPGSGVYKSRLTRICQSDEGDFRNRKLISYTEAQLECKKEGVNYQLLQALAIGRAGSELATKLNIISQSDIVIALFAQAQEDKAEPRGDSAICIYTIKEIELAFQNKTRECWTGKGFSGLSFDGQNNRPKCNAQAKAFNQCNVLSNSPLELDSPITKTAAFILHDDTMLSLAVNSHEEYSVAFIGTKNGKLLKVLLESDKEVSMFSNAQISPLPNPSPIEKLALSKGHDYVFAMATDQLVKVPVAECKTYSNCSSCISSNNPYCGWCVLKNRCSTQEECDNSNQDIHWKQGQPDQCITITFVSPVSAPANERETVTLQVQAQLPQDEVYECVYEKYGNTPASVEQRSDGTAVVTCQTPIVGPAIDRNMPVQLSLKASSNSEPFVHAPDPIMIFDCTIITTCKECSAIGDSGCKWCPYDGGCIYQSSRCNKRTHVTSANVCPTLEYVVPEDRLIPAGVKKSFQVHGRHLPESVEGDEIEYSCNIHIEGRKQTTPGRLTDSNTLECTAFTYDYGGSDGIVTAQVSLKFGGVDIDKPDDLAVEVYKCNQMASDCSQCQGQIDPQYKCSWCTATTQCTLFTESCQTRLEENDKTCPAPTVKSIVPDAGPVSGGTKVTITGVNLGVEFEDIETIYLADAVCNHIMYGALYQVSTRVVCETGYSQTTNRGPVRITVRGEQFTNNLVFFRYMNPEITSISPKIGPKSGGSALTIIGKNLDIGSSASVEIGTEECEIIGERKENKIVCRTTRAGGTKKAKVQLSVDKEKILAENILYQYQADPTITSITPTCSHVSGGIKVMVHGTNLNAIQVAMMDADDSEEVLSSTPGECYPKVDDGNSMVCLTPTVKLKSSTSFVTPIPIVFKLDANIKLRTVNPAQTAQETSSPVPASLNYYPDFTVDAWDNGTTTWIFGGTGSKDSTVSSAFLKIFGKHLTLEGKVSVKVYVGALECKVTQSSTESEVLCTPPSLDDLHDYYRQYEYEIEDNNTDRNKRDSHLTNKKEEPPPKTTFEVKVVMGLREQSPGSLDYLVQSDAITKPGSSDIPLPVVLGTTMAIVVMAIVVTLLIFKYRKNSQRLTAQSEVTKKKMHDLESQVARECKDAFTELQMMVMNDISPRGDLTSLPFLDFSTYAYKVLFPNIEDFQRSTSRFHAAAPNNRAAVIAGLKDFHTLLSSEPFLLNFIHTLEQQPRFNMKDRCNVASLLMVALCQRLDYVTYIMTRLLCNLMKRPQIKTSPHLFLRRTESVAEKFLSNWLTFCLYDHVKQVAGKPLYMLYRAIKATIETGPVDSVTYQARYALSEDRLLRQKIDFKTLSVFLQVEGGQMPVKLLDCDTVTQAKRKLHDTWYNYKNTPVSRRVPVDSLELRLVGQYQSTVLRDEDETSVSEGEWRRLNTLKHYQVADGAVFSFVADSTATNKFGHFTDHAAQFNSNPKLNRSIDLSSSNPKLNRRGSGSSCGHRVWHLTKTNANSTIDSSDQTTFVHVPEIYLTRLLTTKGTLQQFVNDLFVSIFSLSNGDVPPAIKFLFDLLDRQAAENGITDPDIIHTWKNNSIPLRHWINIIKNPEMILDVEKHPLIDSILSVISQTYMDSCSLSNHAFSTDSPSSKLLYAKELQDYKPAVRKFYSDIQALPPVTDEKLYSSLPTTENMQLHRDAALYDLAVYAHNYCYQIDEALQRTNCDELSKKFATVISYLQLYLIPNGGGTT